jgi:hypothetical protein
MQAGAHMTANTTCAGCASPSGPFAAAHNGVVIKLCSECASRLLSGESKETVIKPTTNEKREAA